MPEIYVTVQYTINWNASSRPQQGETQYAGVNVYESILGVLHGLKSGADRQN